MRLSRRFHLRLYRQLNSKRKQSGSAVDSGSLHSKCFSGLVVSDES